MVAIVKEDDMKKFLVLIFLVSLSLLSLSASSEKTLKQEREYLSQSLSVSPRVESSSRAFASASVYNNVAFGSATSSSTTSLDWDAYLGGNQISKKEFFRIAGYEDLYEQCLEIEERNAKNKKNGMLWMTVGGLGAAVGCGIVFANMNYEMEDMVPGLYLCLLSLIPFKIGYDMFSHVEEPNISASFAIGVADVYNKQLAAKIELNF